MRKRLIVLGIVCALGAVWGLAATTASAAGLTPPVADCSHNARLTHDYSAAELRAALETMPAQVSEYSNCAVVIQQALNAKIGQLSGGLGSGGGSFLPTWLLVVLIVLVLGGVGFTGVAIRRR